MTVSNTSVIIKRYENKENVDKKSNLAINVLLIMHVTHLSLCNKHTMRQLSDMYLIDLRPSQIPTHAHTSDETNAQIMAIKCDTGS